MPDRLQERWHASLAGEAIPHRHREELLVASAESREREWPPSPITSRGSETTSSARPRICHSGEGRLLPPARTAAPGQAQAEPAATWARAAQREDRFRPVLARTRPPLLGLRVGPPLTTDARAKQTLIMIRPKVRGRYLGLVHQSHAQWVG